MKIRDRLSQAGEIKVLQKILKMTKRFSGRCEKRRRAGDLIAHGSVNKQGESPDITVAVPDIRLPVLCRKYSQDFSERIPSCLPHCPMQILRDPPDVFRHLFRMDKDTAVDPLQDITGILSRQPAVTVPSLQQIGVVDMTVSVPPDPFIFRYAKR